ncbi:YaaR family protein [Fictibacillus sp. Mic-4]|uniref:YaaR family protein n=1 Tax=Fictibacillus sp. Mic-4 TaxID=3132826 RepID=UPI003CF8E626
MDVQKIWRPGFNPLQPKPSQTAEKVSFAEVMAKGREQQTIEKLNQLMTKIEDQGKVLAEKRTVEELRKYKQLVKEFLEDAVKHGLSLEERRGYNRRGQTKVYQIVQEVDQKITNLTNAVVEGQKSSLDILDVIGELKGLLLNIYT